MSARTAVLGMWSGTAAAIPFLELVPPRLLLPPSPHAVSRGDNAAAPATAIAPLTKDLRFGSRLMVGRLISSKRFDTGGDPSNG
jgi:hypothetical protein